MNPSIVTSGTSLINALITAWVAVGDIFFFEADIFYIIRYFNIFSLHLLTSWFLHFTASYCCLFMCTVHRASLEFFSFPMASFTLSIFFFLFYLYFIDQFVSFNCIASSCFICVFTHIVHRFWCWLWALHSSLLFSLFLP